MALVRGTPQLLVETDADGGLGFETRDGRTVRVVTRDNHAEEHAAMAPYRKKLLVFGCSIAQQCNAYLHSQTSTTSASEVDAGETLVTVLNGAAFTIGHKATVALYNGRLWTTTIQNIAGNDLTFADATPGMIRAGTAITDHVLPTVPALDQGLGAVNAAVALLGGPVEVVPAYG